MKNICLLLLLAIFCSCNNTNTENTSTEKTLVTTVAAKINPVNIKRDTTPTPNVVNKKRSNVIMDTSRSKDKIVKKFPFDIAMTKGDRSAVNSENFFEPNGKPTVLLFWLTTCYPCRIEMKAIKKAYPQWQEEADFNLYAVSTDFQKNYENFVKYVDKADWPWEAVHDTNREFRKVLPGALNGLPQTFVFDKDGKIVYHKRKYSTGDEHKLFEVVKKYAVQ